MTTRRQFIAGARCPQCGEVDKVQRVDDGSRLWMECVRCGMTRDLDAEPAPGAGQPVTLLPPGSGRH